MATQVRAETLRQRSIADAISGKRWVEWIAAVLLIVNVLYAGVNLALFTANPQAYTALGCEVQYYLPDTLCFWTSPMPVPGTATSRAEFFLPIGSPEAASARNFAIVVLLAAALSAFGLVRRHGLAKWLLALTAASAVLGWQNWAQVPIDTAGLGQVLSIAFVLSMLALSVAGVYGLIRQRSWAHGLSVAAGVYGSLVGALWVIIPVALVQVILGIVLILLLLERQAGRTPPLSQRVISWTVIPILIIVAVLVLQTTLITPASGISAQTLNWRTIFRRTQEHLKIVLLASLAAIATAVPMGVLITRDYKLSSQLRRISTALPQAVLIGAGYAMPWAVAWWLQDPAQLGTTQDLVQALVGPIFWALLVGGGLHWLIYSQTKARPEWGTIESWRSLGPMVINIANVGQTVPSLAVLGLSMSFLGIGFAPAIFALWIRALLPILRNTVAGIMTVDQDVIEAARGMGMTRGQVLIRVELPLAMAVIFAGIRTSVVFNVGVGALAFYIGAGGLGHLIAIGIALSNNAILLAGGVLTALLAIIIDFITGHIEERLVPASS